MKSTCCGWFIPRDDITLSSTRPHAHSSFATKYPGTITFKRFSPVCVLEERKRPFYNLYKAARSAPICVSEERGQGSKNIVRHGDIVTVTHVFEVAVQTNRKYMKR